MTHFKCMICGKVDELDKSINDPRYGLICENCHKEVDDRPVKFPPSENTCVCCGEVIPEGRQVCWSCGEKAWDSARTRSYSESEGIMKNPRTDEENRSFYVDDIDFSSINKLLSIHKIIDDAMEKRDRTVSIYIGEAGVSVTVSPYEDEKVQWIYVKIPDGNGGFLGSLKCSNCGYVLADIRDKGSYCSGCGELVHGVMEVETNEREA